MADQNRNQQSNQNQSRNQGQGNQGNQNEPRQAQGNQSNQGNEQGQQNRSRDYESTGIGESRERSSREPASTANDRAAGSERRNVSGTDSESLGEEGLGEEGIESDLDSGSDVDDDIEGGSNR